MKFKVKKLRMLVLAAVSATLLAACGGGTQIDAFVPQRVITFGDESSTITADDKKYTVNAVVMNTTVTPAVPQTPVQLDCLRNPLWAQALAYSYNISYENRCASAATGTRVSGLMFAAPGARVADVALQVDAFLATRSFQSNDLVTLMVGVNDIIALYEAQANPAANESALIDAARQAGTQVGEQVVRITDRGAKVLVSTIPDVGLTPYAAAQETANAGRASLLSRMTTQFNTRLRLKLEDVRDGGRSVGLVLTDELVLALYRSPSLYALNNVSQAACAVALPDCNMTTLVTAAQTPANYASDWLWADDRRLGANAQSRIGTLAGTRARNNPF